MGLGAELLNVVYRSFLKDPNILDITVEDPSEEFVRLRDFVDAQNCRKLEAFTKEKLQSGFSAEMVEEAQTHLKINKVLHNKREHPWGILNWRFSRQQRQARRVYEILRFHATNIADADQYRAYRLDVKRRLNIPYQVKWWKKKTKGDLC